MIQHLETQDFPRLRLGAGPLPQGTEANDYVPRPFNSGQKKIVKVMLEKAAQAVAAICSEGLEIAMNQFNKSEKT